MDIIAGVHGWFPRTCCDKHAKRDLRTPWLFKQEYFGDAMISLCSKTYVARREDKTCKISSKGLQCRWIDNPWERYKQVLDTTISDGVLNRSFRWRNDSMYTCTQKRMGLSYQYWKRIVKSNGINTEPLSITLDPLCGD